MTKKEYLLRILDKLEGVRDLAPGLKIVVENEALGDNTLDMLISAIESSIHSARSEITREKMKKGLDTLTRVQQIEQQSAMKDEQELVELNNLMDSF